jgi:hypothetical protein
MKRYAVIILIKLNINIQKKQEHRRVTHPGAKVKN